MEHPVDLERLSADIYEMLSGSPPGVVVALWADGTLSAHRQLGFRSRRLPDGTSEVPLAAFVSSSDPPGTTAIRARIEKGMSGRDRRAS